MAELGRIAEQYVKLVLAVGQHDDGYVDAYYGPEEWSAEAAAAPRPLEQIGGEVAGLIDALARMSADSDDELLRLRHEYLARQLSAVAARIDMLGGARMSFDEESKALYDAVSPSHPEEYYQQILDELEPLLPGEGALTERFDAFKRRFVIPTERLDDVFRRAVDACRQRTADRLDLPEGESFVIEYVNDKPWSGYNWFKGDFHSLIQVNTDLPIYIDRAVDLACHEGYPGHHTYNALLEKHLVRDRGWVEFSVYPLFSPQSLIAEGTANFGIDMAFPGDERTDFEREELFPLAGLDPATADVYYEVLEKTKRLSYAGNEAARKYIDGEIDADQAAALLARYSLMSAARAQQRVRFIDAYRSYVINYNLGQDLVRQYIDKTAGDDPDRRWQEFEKLLSSPRLPSGL